MKKILKILVAILVIWWVWYGIYFKFIKWDDGAWSYHDIPVNQQSNNIIKVQKKSFSSSIKTTWTTKIRNEQSLNFNVAWKIVAIAYKVWDNVKKWDVIARMASEEIQNEIEKQKISLSDAQRKLKEYTEELRSSGIQKSKLNLDLSLQQLKQKEREIEEMKENHQRNIRTQQLVLQQSRNAFKVLKRETEKNIANMSFSTPERQNALREKQNQLKKAELEYKDFKSKFNLKLKQQINEHNNKLNDIYLSLKTSVSNIKQDLEQISKIYWLKHYSPFKHYNLYSAKNISYKETGKSRALESKSKFKLFESAVDRIRDSKDTKSIINALNMKKDFYDSFYNTTNMLVMGFDSSVESVDFSSEIIASYKSSFSNMRSTARSAANSINSKIDEINNQKSKEQIERDLKEQLENLKQNIENLKVSLKKLNNNQKFDVNTENYGKQELKIKLSQSKIDLEKQESDFKKTLEKQNAELYQSQISLKRERITYQEQVKEHSKLSSLSKNQNYIALENEVKQQKIALNNIYERLDKYVIKAPFDWVLTKIDIKVWDRLNADNQKKIIIVNPNTIEIEASVTQSDIVKVKKWMLVSISMDSYKNEQFTWTITEVNTTPTEEWGSQSSWPKKFKIVTSLNNPKNLKLYSWISAIVNINYSKIPESLVVPYSSVSSNENWEKYVTVVDNKWNKKKVSIKVWYTDWKIYQVLSWLKEWDSIMELDYNSSSFNPGWNNTMGGEEWWDDMMIWWPWWF